MKSIIFATLFLLCVLRPVYAQAVCAAGRYNSAAAGSSATCSACPVKCSTCDVSTTCTACAVSTATAPTNRVDWASTATDCAYLFLL